MDGRCSPQMRTPPARRLPDLADRGDERRVADRELGPRLPERDQRDHGGDQCEAGGDREPPFLPLAKACAAPCVAPCCCAAARTAPMMPMPSEPPVSRAVLK